MKFLSTALGLLLILSACSSSSDFELNQENVKALIDSVELATKNRNAEGVVSHFTDDAVISINMPSDMGGNQVWNLSEYKTMLEKGWAVPVSYTHELKDIEITIHDANNAFVTDTVVEEIIMNGSVVMSTRTDEETVVVVEDGRAKIKSVTGRMSM
ncbi:hypothetical protein NBRC116493_32740 [Aurantivibrio infirmus]